jgi:hypothetical protein
MLKSVLLVAFITLLALWMLYLIDEERFRGVRTCAENVWNVTIAAMPQQIIEETGQKFKKITKPTIAFVWNKTEATYMWLNTDPTVKEYFEVGRALWKVLFSKVSDLYWTVDKQIPLYVETVKNKIF